MKLYKTTIVIWSDSDPSNLELSQLAKDAEDGDSYCSTYYTKEIENVGDDPDWDGTEFFGTDEDDDMK